MARRLIGAAREHLVAGLVERYTAGVSIRELAEATGRSYGFVHAALLAAGVTMRPRGGARRPRLR